MTDPEVDDAVAAETDRRWRDAAVSMALFIAIFAVVSAWMEASMGVPPRFAIAFFSFNTVTHALSLLLHRGNCVESGCAGCVTLFVSGIVTLGLGAAAVGQAHP